MYVYADGSDDDRNAKVFRKDGKLEHGNCISRDIIVPKDIPLYALHYVIQRAFDDSWDIRTAFLNYPDKVLVTPGQDS